MKPYAVLGVYKPTRWNSRLVGRDLTRMTRELGLVPHVDPAHGPLHSAAWWSDALHAEVRRRTFKTKQAEGWHFDGDLEPKANPNCCLVTWASNHPTEIKWQGKVYQPKPYEVVIFKNRTTQHRRPENCPRIRWLFRQRVAIPTHMELP